MNDRRDPRAIHIDRVMVPDHAPTTLAVWLITGPFHPFWNQWLVSLVHLRHSPDKPPAKKHFPDATHELIIVSLEPETGTRSSQWTANEVGEAFEQNKGVRWLHPMDLAHQFQVDSDEEAVNVIELMMGRVQHGMLSPDQDFRQAWKKMIDREVAEPHT